MAVDESLPPSELPQKASIEEIEAFFREHVGVKIDHGELASRDLAATRARLIEPPEAHLLYRVLRLFPDQVRVAVERVLIVEAAAVVQQGAYSRGIVRLDASASPLREADPEFPGRYSRFVVTAVHERGHAVFARVLNDDQRAAVADHYVGVVLQEDLWTPDDEPTELGAEHHFVDIFVRAILLGGHQRQELRRFGIAIDQ